MAVTWMWDEKIGKLTYTAYNKEKITLDLWKGNCLLIAQYNIPNTNQYQMMFFFGDEGHMKRCFGIEGERKDNMFKDEPWEEIRFNEKVNLKDFVKITKAIKKVFPKCRIVLE